MPLKMRPTGLGSGTYKDNVDYSVFSGEWLIGRIYERNGSRMKFWRCADATAHHAHRWHCCARPRSRRTLPAQLAIRSWELCSPVTVCGSILF
jgi:hypothetical protein